MALGQDGSDVQTQTVLIEQIVNYGRFFEGTNARLKGEKVATSVICHFSTKFFYPGERGHCNSHYPPPPDFSHVHVLYFKYMHFKAWFLNFAKLDIKQLDKDGQHTHFQIPVNNMLLMTAVNSRCNLHKLLSCFLFRHSTMGDQMI